MIYTRPPECFIPYKDAMELNKDFTVLLGVDDDIAWRLQKLKAVRIPATIFWLIVSHLVPIAGIVLSFTYEWWAFIPGVVLCCMLFNANKKANGKNMLDLILRDENCYNIVAMHGGVLYVYSEEHADMFTKYY